MNASYLPEDIKVYSILDTTHIITDIYVTTIDVTPIRIFFLFLIFLLEASTGTTWLPATIE